MKESNKEGMYFEFKKLKRFLFTDVKLKNLSLAEKGKDDCVTCGNQD